MEAGASGDGEIVPQFLLTLNFPSSLRSCDSSSGL